MRTPPPGSDPPCPGRPRRGHGPEPEAHPWHWLQPLLLAPGLVSLAGLVLAAPNAAQLPDPTRPPVALQMSTAVRDMAQRLGPALPGSPPAAPAEAQPQRALPLLQGVQIGQRGTASAMVDGQLVGVGDSVGDQKVMAIDRYGVTLRGSQGEQRLQLLSGDAKQPAGSIHLGRSAGFTPGSAPSVQKTQRPASAPAQPAEAAPPAVPPANPAAPAVAVADKTRP